MQDRLGYDHPNKAIDLVMPMTFFLCVVGGRTIFDQPLVLEFFWGSKIGGPHSGGPSFF
jgi:hypothetical protein